MVEGSVALGQPLLQDIMMDYDQSGLHEEVHNQLNVSQRLRIS